MDVFSAHQDARQTVILNPGKTAVLVVDMLYDFCDPSGAMCLPGAERLFPVQNSVIGRARDAGMMIGWIVDAHRAANRQDREFLKRAPHCLEGTQGIDVMPQLDKQDGDFVFRKRRFSAFVGTDLDLTLRDNLIETVIVFGVVTNICVRATVHDAFFNGYQVVVAHDACAATGAREQASSLYDIATHFGVVTDARQILDAIVSGKPLASMLEFETTDA